MAAIDFNYWYLTLPTGAQGHPKTVEPPELATYHDANFFMDGDGWTFVGPCDGVHTVHSKYPRSELRERSAPKIDAGWDITAGEHELVYEAAVLQLPKHKPEVVVGQIHDSKDDVLLIHLSGKNLTARVGTMSVLLDSHYMLGTRFRVTIGVKKGVISVRYRSPTVDQLWPPIVKPKVSGPCYFKVGCYTQSNPAHGDGKGEAGKVIVYSAKCTHL